jgi:hypothetical protein
MHSQRVCTLRSWPCRGRRAEHVGAGVSSAAHIGSAVEGQKRGRERVERTTWQGRARTSGQAEWPDCAGPSRQPAHASCRAARACTRPPGPTRCVRGRAGEPAAAVRVQAGQRERAAVAVVGLRHALCRRVQDEREELQRGVRREGAAGRGPCCARARSAAVCAVRLLGVRHAQDAAS